MKIFKKALIATAVGIALAGPAQAGSVKIDVNGTGVGADMMGVDQFIINMFTWNAGNALIVNTTPQGAADDPTVMLAQAALSSVSGNGSSFSYSNVPPGSPAGNPGGTGPLISGQLTYQLRMNLDVEPNSGSAIDYFASTNTGTFFDVYYNPVKIANDVTGCGYGSHQSATCGAFGGTLILSGFAVLGEPVTLTQAPSTTVAGLDGFADGLGDVDNGVSSRSLSMGAMSIKVDVTYQDSTFLLTNIISTTVDLEPDLQHTETGGSPFTQANPSNEVVGRELQNSAAQLDATYGTERINNIQLGSCGGSANCDVHLQSNPSTSVITSIVPEPGSLALLGLGLAMFGGMGRRWRRGSAA